MLINNTIVQLPDEFADYEKSSKGAFSELNINIYNKIILI